MLTKIGKMKGRQGKPEFVLVLASSLVETSSGQLELDFRRKG